MRAPASTLRRLMPLVDVLLDIRRWPAARTVSVGLLVGCAGVIVFEPVRGVPGLLTLCVAMIIGIHVTPAAGALVAMVVGVVFAFRIQDRASASGLLIAVPLWALVAVVAGAAAQRMRSAREEQADYAEELRHRTLHDALTGLPNRMLVLDRLTHALHRARRTGSGVGVLFLDLDEFKVVNDSLGHDRGDELLVEMGRRLTSVLRAGDTAARLGGDEFVVVCEDLDPADENAEMALVVERVAAALREPFRIAGRDIMCTASMGIAVAAADHDQPEQLLRDADMAMYRAKRRGRGRVDVFDDDLRTRALHRMQTELSLRRAVAEGELSLQYQPVVDVTTGRMVGVESLVRWVHPERGLVAPEEFLPVAEASGLVVPLGRWVLTEACRQAAVWQKEAEAGHPFWLAVNVSLQELTEGTFAQAVATAVAEAGVDPGRLRLEITERAMLEVARLTATELARLDEQGVMIGLDDFGTGYSSLALLRRFPVRFLKIDQTFVTGLDENRGDEAIVEAVLGLGRSLGLEVVAEGIETPGQLSQVARLGCRLGQGFHLARPQAAADISHRLRQQRHTVAPAAPAR